MPISGPTIVAIDERCHNPDQVSQLLRRCTGADVRVEPELDGQFGLGSRVTAGLGIGVADFQLDHGSRWLYLSAKEMVAVSYISDGHGVVRAGERDVPMQPGQGFIFEMSRAKSVEMAAGTSLRFLMMYLADVNRSIAEMYDVPIPRDFTWACMFSRADEGGRLIVHIADALAASLWTPRPTAQVANAIRLLREALIIAIVEIMPGLVSDSLRRAPVGTSERQIRRAVDYIRNAQHPPTIKDVAEHVGIGIRALQIGFKRHVGIPPHVLLKRTRLERARSDLQDTETGDVRGVAQRWGFGNVGRFSGEYFKEFGEYPSTTLARSRER